MRPERRITIYYQNVRGLNTKTVDFFNAVSVSDFDVIAITETWLDCHISNRELFFDTYDTFRSDRKFHQLGLSRGGGALLAIRSKLKASNIELGDVFDGQPSVDIVATKIVFHGMSLIICCIYVPPNFTVTQYGHLFDALCSIQGMHDADIFIIGDFNITAYSQQYSLLNPCGAVLALRDFLNLFQLDQCNFIQNGHDRILDLVISNLECPVEAAVDPLLEEDIHHPALVIHLPTSNFASPSDVPDTLNPYRWNFKKGNLVLLYEMLAQVDWSELLECSDVNAATDWLYDRLQQLFDLTIPRTRTQRTLYPPWFNGSIIHNIRMKKKLWKKYKRSREDIDLVQYKRVRSSLKSEIRSAHSQYMSHLEQNISVDPSNFWKYLSSRRCLPGISGTFDIGDGSTSDLQLIADAFAQHFQNSYIQSNLDHNICSNTDPNRDDLLIDVFSEEEVLASLRKLRGKLTAGPDQIPSFLLKDCGLVLAKPLTIIFNLCLRTGIFPVKWRLSKLCPVFKKGNKALVSNYRPVTIICNFSKVFERLLFDRIDSFFRMQLVASQHGFVKGRSTVTNLFCVTQFISQSLDDKVQCDVIYTDFSKAFDQLDHGILLSKLRQCGFSPSLIDLFRSYLTGREQFVLLHGHKSRTVSVTSGVPQGSVLGPLLFNIFINDITADLDPGIQSLLYADDLKLYTRVSSYIDCEFLQNNLDKVVTWCRNNRLSLNVGKCHVMTFSLLQNTTEFPYSINGDILTRPQTIRDLGVIFDHKLSFIEHISHTVSSAYKSLGFIMRNSRNFNRAETLVLLFNTFVRSRLEYAAVIWEPCYEIHISYIESIQRRFLKFLTFKSEGVYPCIGFPHGVLLRQHNFQSLQVRRQYMLLVFLHGLFNQKIDCSAILQMLQYNTPRPASRNALFFYLPTPRTNKLKFSPLYRLCDSYNKVCHRIDVADCSVACLRQLIFR